MGPLANPRRVNAIEAFVQDAQEKGAKVATGGKRIGNQGNFFEPTVLTDVPESARIMNEEPFGGVKDSGFGYEGGTEGLLVYMTGKFVSYMG